MRRTGQFCLLLYLIVLPVLLYGQTNTDFWFAAPEVTQGHGDQPIYLRLTSFSQSANVTISEPANTVNFPTQNLNIPANGTITMDLTSLKDQVECKPPNTVLNLGIHIHSDVPITAYYEVAHTNNPDLFTLKGNNATGMSFYIPSQDTLYNQPLTPPAYNSFDIIATLDNTTVTITPKQPIVGHAAGIPFQVVLNKGQVYSAQATGQQGKDHLQGSRVTSDKAICITVKDDSDRFPGTGCYDLGGDQIVPINILGQQYIVVRGYTSTVVNDWVFVMATADNTSVSVNGAFVTTLNAGERYRYKMLNTELSSYVETSLPAYVWHLTGYGCETGSAILPPMNCTGSSQVAFTRSTSYSFELIILTKAGAEGSFTLDGAASPLITASAFSPVTGNPSYVFARIDFPVANMAVGAHILANSQDIFHMGIIHTYNAGQAGCSYGYFTDFASLNLGPDQTVCPGTSILLDAGPNRQSYTWYFNGSIYATGVQTITVSNPGQYVSLVNDHGCMLRDTLNLANSTLPSPSITGNTSFCQGLSTTLTVAPSFPSYLWTTGATTQSINVTAGGNYGVTVTDNNGCQGSTSLSVTMIPAPVPSFINPPPAACLNVPGNTYTTQSGMNNYLWTVTGGTVTAGGTATDNSVTVTWTAVGMGSVSLMYTDPATGCSAIVPTILAVTVNPLPVPAFSGGDPAACIGTPGHNYTVQAGMQNYIWTISGGTITAGGGLNDNSATVSWTSTGAQSVSCNFTDPATQCTGASPTAYNVTVNALPVPSISGPGAACLNTSASYTTEAGMSGYLWSVTGGTITSGGGTSDNTVTILWNTLGTGSISVNYSDANGCTAVSPFIYNVSVNTLPVPTITGSGSVCVGLPQTYSTEGGMTGYTWNVSSGGTITAGSGTNSITVLWNSTGTNSVEVNYIVGTGCTAPVPSSLTVEVHALPAPTISGNQTVCQGTSHTYFTEAGMVGYLWTVSSGGTITSGAGTNTITVLWNSPGAATLNVNYTNSDNCTAQNPSVHTVTVNPAPVPAITAPAAACLNSTSLATTAAGMSNYSWTVTGGNITSGAGTNSISILWNLTGGQTITLVYTDPNGCLPLSPSSVTIQVNSLPSPVISGPQQVCYNQSGSVYSSPNHAQHDYLWTVTGAVSFTGNHTSAITVDWGPSGSGTVQLTETDQSQPTNCSTTTPVYNVVINPAPNPVISGPSTPCGQTTQTYTVGTVQANHAYSWTVSGGTPSSGSNSSITVNWGNANPVSVGITESITYAPGVVCSATAPAFPVSLVLIPDAAGTITGPLSTCPGLNQSFSVGAISNADSYTWWFVPAAGVTITNNGSSALINFDLSSASGNLYVQGNKTGCASGPASPAHPVTVYPQPYVSLSLCNDNKTTSTSRAFSLKGGVPPGGLYYIDGNPCPTGIFDPALLSTTSHSVTYRFTDFRSCINTSNPVMITVVPGSSLSSCPNTFTDPRDNRIYRAFLMGTRCWMTENLNYGTSLVPTDQPQRDNCIPEKYCLPSDAGCTANGGFYQWDELMQYQVPAAGSFVQGLCPPEWHVPNMSEWQLLIDGQVNSGNGMAGADLKDLNPLFGFHALLSGIYYQNSLWNFTSGTLTATMFWTSTVSPSSGRIYCRGLNIINPSVSNYFSSRGNALPVRCVKD